MSNILKWFWPKTSSWKWRRIFLWSWNDEGLPKPESIRSNCKKMLDLTLERFKEKKKKINPLFQVTERKKQSFIFFWGKCLQHGKGLINVLNLLRSSYKWMRKKRKPTEKVDKRHFTVHKRTVDTWIKEIKIETRCHSLHVKFANVKKKKSRTGKWS